MKKVTTTILLLIILFLLVRQIPDRNFHVVICDVGQGDGILLTLGSTQILIDAGPDNAVLDCLGVHMPFWDRTIEIAMMTHADADHYYGFIEVAKRYHIDQMIGSDIDNEGSGFEALKTIVAAQKIPVIEAMSGKSIVVDGLSLKILFPTQEFLESHSQSKNVSSVLGSRTSSSRNDSCVVSHVQYGSFSALFACDISPSSGEKMVRDGLVPYSYFLKVSHHGSKNGLTQDFLDAVKPTVAGISVGSKNRYGHPSPEITTMLSKKGVRVLRTDRNGEFELTTNGTRVWVRE